MGRARGARDNAPRLRDRIDAAFDAAGRAERRAVIEVTAPIPGAVPSFLLERFCQRRRVPPPGRSAPLVAANISQRRERLQRRVEEPSEPDALALACLANAIHAVVPVAGFEQGNSMHADRKALVQPKRAMFEDCAALLRDRGLKKRFNLGSVQRRADEEPARLVEHACLAGLLNIMSDPTPEPDTITVKTTTN